MPETAILAALLVGCIYLARNRWAQLQGIWQAARWWEKALLLACLLPVPGPIDELAGLVVLRRVAKRKV